MALLPIVINPDERLRTICAPVTAFDAALAALVSDMFDTMYDAPGRGLAAPQVGVLQRLFVFDSDWKDAESRNPRVMVNPEVLWTSEETQEFTEGCLSIPDTPCRLARPARITMRWQDLDGTAFEDTFEGVSAVVVQHEFDHLDGVLIIDRPALPIPAPAEAAADQAAATEENA